MPQWLSVFIPTICAVIIGIIGFFLKRSFDRIDRLEDIVGKIKEDYITKDDFFREQSKIERSIKDVMSLLIEIKGKVG
ncbi:MAG: hypothetical protein LBS36_01900 [Oscillospiraceae bacterium]|nr:hypothetical protein [Oscillospiraceae bacterium]